MCTGVGNHLVIPQDCLPGPAYKGETGCQELNAKWQTDFNYCCPLYNGGQASKAAGQGPWPFGLDTSTSRPGCTEYGPYLSKAAKWIGQGGGCKMCAPPLHTRSTVVAS